MSIYGAINSATSGLTAQANALLNISGNVANSQTIGFKRLDTTFADIVSGGGGVQGAQASGTTFSTSRATNSLQGDISDSDNDTYMAINGDGYFVVTTSSGVVDGNTTFSQNEYYTRAGDFEVDDEGHLINSSGYYLMGIELDPTTGNAVGDDPEVVTISDQPLSASATTQITYQANLPSYPQTTNADETVTGSELLDTSGTITATSDITSAQESEFLASSISGQSVTVYDANGSPVNVEIRWAKTIEEDASVPAVDTWNAYYSAGNGAWTVIGSIEFDSAGAMGTLTALGANTVNAAGNGFTLTDLTVDGTDVGDVSLSFANGSLTQYDDPDGVASSVDLNQDGYPSGEITGVSVDSSGRLVATYSNQQTRGLYEIPLATFEADQNLKRLDGAAFAATSTSGSAVYDNAGTIVANALELSNADIAAEFSKLIITQQAYAANSRVMTSANAMLDDALNLIR